MHLSLEILPWGEEEEIYHGLPSDRGRIFSHMIKQKPQNPKVKGDGSWIAGSCVLLPFQPKSKTETVFEETGKR